VLPESRTRGRAKVYVDGVLVKTIDTYRSAFAARRVMFTRTWASTGTHTIRLVVLGTSGRPRVDFDALVIIR
jgi:hypothetical protein